MKLLGCYIENFGKLHQVEYHFTDGFNVIYEENGFGKTTLAMFIRSMFYGFPRDTQVNKDRKHYLPYNGLTCGGYLDFEINELQYRIQRTFGKSLSNDHFALFDLQTKLKSNDYDESIGEEIFHMDIHSFSNILFHYQSQLNFESNETITQRLQGMIEQKDIISVEEAIGALKGYVLAYGENSKQLKKRSIRKLKELYNEKERSIQQDDLLQKDYEQKEAKLHELKDSLAFNNEQRSYYQKAIQQAYQQNKINQAKEEYQRLIEDQKSIVILDLPKIDEEKLHQYSDLALQFYQKQDNVYELNEEENMILAHFKKYPCDDATFQQLTTLVENYVRQNKAVPLSEKEKEQVSIYQSCFDSINDAKIKLFFKKIKRKQHKQNISMLICLLGIMISILLVYFVSYYFSVLVLVFFIFLLFSYFHFSSKNEIEILKARFKRIINQEDDLDELRSEILEHFHQYENLRARSTIETNDLYPLLITLYKKLGIENQDDIIQSYYDYKIKYVQYSKLLKKEQILQKSKEEYELLDQTIKAFFIENHLEIKHDYYSSLHALEEVYEQNKTNQYYYYKIQEQLNDLLVKYKDIDLMGDYKDEIDVNHLLNQYQEFDNEHLNQSIHVYEQDLQKLTIKIEETKKAKEEAKQIQDELADLTTKVNAIQKAATYLEKANQSFMIQYASSIEETFMKYYHRLVSLNQSIQIDLNQQIFIDGKATDTLSEGSRDLIYLCMRFTMIDLLFKKDEVMIIFDDPFTNLDDKKVHLGLQLLKEMASQYQIIYFTCHQSRK